VAKWSIGETANAGGIGMIDSKLLKILACPVCKEPVEEQDGWIVCAACRKRYPIRDGIPIMLVEEAEDLPAEE
jgi:uncharacterized protein